MRQRRTWRAVVLLAALALGACQAVPNAKHISLQSPEALRVQEALARWPKPDAVTGLRRSFFATIRVAGTRTTASGILEYYGPRDFRITAVTELGVILFDGRMNWAGATVLRLMPGMNQGVIETMLSDLSRAFEVPADLEGLKAGETKMVLTRQPGEGHQYTWIFDKGDGRLLETEVEMGLLDTLRVSYKGYSAAGWPRELEVVRRARLYEVAFSFTDGK